MRRDGSRLLRTVQGQPHATQNDHHDDIKSSVSPLATGANGFRFPANLDGTAGKGNIDVVRDARKLRRPSATTLNDATEIPNKDVNRDPDSSDPEEEDIPSMRRPGATVYVPDHLRDGETSRQKRKKGIDNIHALQEDASPKRARSARNTRSKDELKVPEGWRPIPTRPGDDNEHFATSKKPARTFGRIAPARPPGLLRKPTSASVLLGNRTGRPEKPKLRHTTPLVTPPSNASKFTSQLSDDSLAGADDLLDPDEQTGIDVEPETASQKSNSSAAAKSSQEAPKLRYFSSLTQYESNLPAEKIEEIEQERVAEEEKKKKKQKEDAAAARRRPLEGPCPMQCGKMLKMSVLDGLSEKATFKEQQRFCRKHREEDATAAWQDRGYPMQQDSPYIDWPGFADRLEGFDTDIQTFFKKPNSLHFRKKMAERIKSGKSRTLLQQMKNEGLDSLGAGYYGTKGHDLMTNHISRTFARELRDKAAKDTMMSAQGAMAYVQEVLVPELACRLIMDDRNCNPVEARKVMAESSEIGDLLWPSESSGLGDGKKKGRSSRFLDGD